MGRGRLDLRLWALLAAGSRPRCPCPSPALPPGTLLSGTPSPSATSLGPLSLPVPGPLGHSGPFPS